MAGMELCFHISWVNLFGKIIQFVLRVKNNSKSGDTVFNYEEKTEEKIGKLF